VRRYGPGDIYGDDLQAELELKGTCVARSTGPSGLRVTTLIQPPARERQLVMQDLLTRRGLNFMSTLHWG